jgi:hypothetical protein
LSTWAALTIPQAIVIGAAILAIGSIVCTWIVCTMLCVHDDEHR